MRTLVFLFLFSLARPALADCVILLHGLARSEGSLIVMEAALDAEGFDVVRPGYPSTSASVEALADAVLPWALDRCGAARTHVVTHSMGGILLRHWISANGIPDRLGRVVMMGPPNQGSEVVDTLGDLAAFGWINGPAGSQLGTGPTSLPRKLPPVRYPVGVIAGSQSLNPYFSSLLPGPDDGKVSVEATRVDGMVAHLTLPVTHTFMMNNPRVLVQVVHFLRNGRFDPNLTWAEAVLDQLGGVDDARD
ncbi:MAG: alpha/beta fold hydrolase [Pseudomonadota bacterium]